MNNEYYNIIINTNIINNCVYWKQAKVASFSSSVPDIWRTIPQAYLEKLHYWPKPMNKKRAMHKRSNSSTLTLSSNGTCSLTVKVQWAGQGGSAAYSVYFTIRSSVQESSPSVALSSEREKKAAQTLLLLLPFNHLHLSSVLQKRSGGGRAKKRTQREKASGFRVE